MKEKKEVKLLVFTTEKLQSLSPHIKIKWSHLTNNSHWKIALIFPENNLKLNVLSLLWPEQRWNQNFSFFLFFMQIEKILSNNNSDNTVAIGRNWYQNT